MATEETRIGVWLNKRLVTALELPFAHEVEDGGDERWLLHVRGRGKATARFRDGSAQGVDVEPGDFVLASREAIYVSRTAPLPPTPTPDEARGDGRARGERTAARSTRRRTAGAQRAGGRRRRES